MCTYFLDSHSLPLLSPVDIVFILGHRLLPCFEGAGHEGRQVKVWERHGVIRGEGEWSGDGVAMEGTVEGTVEGQLEGQLAGGSSGGKCRAGCFMKYVCAGNTR